LRWREQYCRLHSLVLLEVVQRMAYTLRRLDYEPHILCPDTTAVIAVCVIGADGEVEEALLRDDLDEISERFPDADLEYLQAVVSELRSIRNNPKRLWEYVYEHLEHANVGVILQDPDVSACQSLADARARAQRMLKS